jgi:hypothetical protein
MRTIGYGCLACFVTVAALTCAGCSPSSGDPSGVVAEGILYSVQYQTVGERTEGFTRINDNRTVPGGNGSWNVDAYGKLTRDYLLIMRPPHRDLGPQVIPAHRLLSVQFGDGGIKDVKENQPAAPK